MTFDDDTDVKSAANPILKVASTAVEQPHLVDFYLVIMT